MNHKYEFLVFSIVSLSVVGGMFSQPLRAWAEPDKNLKQEKKMANIMVKSEAIAEGQAIPKRHTGEGEDVSPILSFSGIPEGTKELALIMDDPDAPTPEPWVHWVIYGLSSDTEGLQEGVPNKPALTTPVKALQGKNSWGTVGYRGPMPPPGHGTHRYYFKLYALDAQLSLSPGLDKKQLLQAISSHILAEGQLMGTYER